MRAREPVPKVTECSEAPVSAFAQAAEMVLSGSLEPVAKEGALYGSAGLQPDALARSQ